MNNFSNLLARALTVMNERLTEMNTATRIGSLFRDIIGAISNLDKNNKGYYSSVTKLETDLPNPQSGWYAYVGETNTIWEVVNGQWSNSGEPIPSDVDLSGLVSKEDVDLGALQTFQLISNEEFILAVIDYSDTILFGIRLDGATYIPKGLPHDVIKALKDKLSFKDVQNFISDSSLPISAKAVKEAIATLGNYQQSGEFVKVVTDAKGHILYGVRDDGTFYIPKGEQKDATRNFRKIFENLEALNKKTQYTAIREDVQYIKAVVDSENRILYAVELDGTIYIPKLKSDSLSTNIEQANKDIRKYIQIPTPRGLPTLNIRGVNLNALSKDTDTIGYADYNDIDGNSFSSKILISYQGSSSMNFPKKNLSISFVNDAGEDVAIKFGQWPEIDSYHLKANFIDASHVRNIGAYKLYEQFVRTREIGNRYPIDKPYNETNGDYESRIFKGAMGHPDGFPIEIYSDGKYWGLFTLNLSKNRANYWMKKKDNGVDSSRLRIQLELGGGTNTNNNWNALNWGDYEVRNPSVKNVTGGDYKEGDEIEESPAKQVVSEFFEWLNSGLTDEEFKAQLPNWVSLNHIVDYMVLMQITRNGDSWTRNGQFCYYGEYENGVSVGKWYPMPYDLDQSYGLTSQGVEIITPYYDVFPAISWQPTAPFWSRIRKLFLPEIKARYKELRDKNIISYDNLLAINESIIETIGYEAYLRDYKKWTYETGVCMIPSNRPSDSVVPDEYKNAFNVDGGCFTDKVQIMSWIKQRIAFVDNLLEYNK